MAQRHNRVSSSVDKLPEGIKEQLDARLLDTANSYVGISEWLEAEGFDISKSAIGRYAIRSSKAAQRVSQVLSQTKAIADIVNAHPDLDYTKASRLIMMDGLMQRVSTAEEDFMSMPLDKAGRLIASLSRTDIYEKNANRAAKNKMELAFDQLEQELMAAIKKSPELCTELHCILTRAREKVASDEN